MKMNLWDAQAALGFVITQQSYIEPGVNMRVYPDVQYPGLVPVDTSAHPFTTSVTYFSGDMFGRADWINGNSDDIPLAGTERSKFETPVYTAGIGYGYGWEEIGRAQMFGMNLPADDAQAARRAYMEMVDRIAVTTGDTLKGFSPLINHSAITPTNVPNGAWMTSGTTDADIIQDFNYGLRLSWSGTLYTSIADTVLLPNLHLDYLNSRVLANTAQTLLSFLKANNTYTNQTGRPLMIRGVRGLETRGVSATARMVTYRRSDEVLKLHMPMPHRFLQAQPQGAGLRIVVPGVFRIGGLDIRRPAEVKYNDGI